MLTKIISLIILYVLLTGPAWALDSLNVTRLGQYPFWYNVNDLAVAGNYACVAEMYYLRLMDVSHPTAPREIGYSNWHGNAVCMNPAGTLVYLAGGGLTILNISNPQVPVELGFCATPNYVTGLAVAYPFAFLVGYFGSLRIIDVSNPNIPIEVGTCNLPGSGEAVTVAGNYVFVAAGSQGLIIVDVSNPTVPVTVGRYQTQYYAQDVAASGGLVYLLDPGSPDAGLKILNVSNPTLPVLLGSVGCYEDGYEVKVSGNYAYVAVPGRGLRVIDVSNPANPEEVCIYIHGDGTTVEILGNYVYLGGYGSFSIHNITNPPSPFLMGAFTTPQLGANHVVILDSYAYLVMEYYGLEIMDVSNLTMPMVASYFPTPGEAQNLALAYPYVYLADGNAGLRIINVSHPAAPVETGHCSLTGYVQGVVVSGSYAYLACGSGDLRIVDVSNPAVPVEIGACTYLPGNARSVAVSGSYAYVGRDEGGLLIVNVSNPMAPVLVGSYSYGDMTEKIVISDSLAFIANWNNGAHILNISNPAAPIQLCQVNNPNGFATGLDVFGSLLFLVGDLMGLEVLNVSHPTAPVEVGHYSGVGNFNDVAVHDSIAYGSQYLRFGIYDVSQCNPSAAMTLMPVNPPIYIPAQGGSFQYTITVGNFLTSPQTFDAWIMVRLPYQTWYHLVLGPLTLTLPGETVLTRLRTQTVPASAPPGFYLYEARIGDYPNYISFLDNFTFQKYAIGDGDLIEDWCCSGELFPGEIGGTCSVVPDFRFSGVFPNPFNASTAISYKLQASSYVSLKVYDTTGRLVETLVDGWRQAGTHCATFNGSGLASGIYLAKFSAGEFTAVQKLVLIK